MRRILLAAVACLVSACSDEMSTVEVDVVSGLVAGVEFATVHVDLVDPASGSEAASVLVHQEENVRLGTDFSRGARVASFSIEKGQALFRVRLLRRDGSLLIENSVRASVGDNAVVRVHLTRDCVGVACPAPGGASAALTSCLGGTCVEDTCDPLVGGTCEDVAICRADVDCPEVSECALNHCVDGVCVPSTSSEATCEVTDWCNPDVGHGCEPLPMDVTPIDASIVDAGIDAPIDQGMDVLMVACGTLCELPSDPCAIARWDCSMATPVCAIDARWPPGHSCGENRVCDNGGVCNECYQGSSCRSGCVLGTVDCSVGESFCVTPGHTALEFASEGTSCSLTEACVDADARACGTGHVCDASGACVACVDGRECATSDCSRGVIDCAAGGICVVASGVASEGTACDFEISSTGAVLRPSAYCGADGSCAECAHNVLCDTGNVCRRGRTDCELGADACVAVSTAERSGNLGGACPGGACDGYGTCVAPFEVSDVALTDLYACAADVGGAVYCWGAPADVHVLGVDTAPSVGGRALVSGIANAVEVSVGALRACARNGAGAVACWGASTPLSATSDTVPVPVPGLSVAVRSFGVGNRFECFLLEDATVACWGAAFYNGTASDNDVAPSLVPGLTNVDELSVSPKRACALLHDGTVRCWGDSLFENGTQLPLPFREYGANYPVADESTLAVKTHVTHVSTGPSITCTIQDLSGTQIVGCVGDPSLFSGYGTYLTPLSFFFAFNDATSITVGDDFNSMAYSYRYPVMCLTRAGGEVWCMGNTYSVPGGPSDAPLPGVSTWHLIPDFTSHDALRIGTRVVCGRSDAGELTCWGGTDTMLGAGATGVQRYYPTRVPAP